MEQQHPLLLASVLVVLRTQPALDGLPHITRTIHEFVDVSAHFNLAQAARVKSLILLDRVGSRQLKQWRDLPPLLRKSYLQQQFADAMTVIATNGFIDGSKWLHEVYFSNGKVSRVMHATAKYGHTELLEWILDTFPDDQYMTLPAVNEAMCKGFVDTIRVLLSRRKGWMVFTLHHMNYTFSGGRLQMVQLLYENFPALESEPLMKDAALHGRLDTMQWLYDQRGEPFTKETFDAAVKGGHLYITKFLFEQDKSIAVFSSTNMGVAASGGHIEMLDWLHENRTETFDIQSSVTLEVTKWWLPEDSLHAYWKVCKWLHSHDYDCAAQFVQLASITGNLPMLQWLRDKYRHIFDSARLRLGTIAANGHLIVLQWLCSVGYEMTHEAMQGAAKGGYLPIVQFLHQQYPDFSTSRAMGIAAQHGHLEIVRLFHRAGIDRCSSIAMDCTAQNNHMKVVRYLHEHNLAVCTTYAMDYTSSIEILNYLHANRTEGCTTLAYVNAAKRGNLEVLEWLYSHKQELMDLELVREIARQHEQFHVMYWVDAVRAGELS